MKALTFFSCVLFSIAVLGQQVSYKAAVPEWVDKQAIPDYSNIEADGGEDILLNDRQVNFNDFLRYYHYAFRLNSSESVQDFSTLSISFDPDFQEFYFHKVLVHRNGKTIDKLKGHRIETYQREENLERHLYDGSVTAVIHLQDMRKGDVLEYSFSINGENKAFADHCYSYQEFEFSEDLSKVYYRVVVPPGKEVRYSLFNDAPEPKEVKGKNGREYIWKLKDLKGRFHFADQPAWINVSPRVIFTDYKNWEDLASYTSGKYSYSEEEMKFLKSALSEITVSKDVDERINDIVNFVQDDIRYLGFENGLNAYIPHSVEKVYKQRFGDCKDKSHLLVGLLRADSIEAYPLLVSSSISKGLGGYLPSPYVFDHCVVTFINDEEEYFIDPTISDQGGSYEYRQFPRYGKGLLLKEGGSLIDLPMNTKGTIEVTEDIKIREDRDAKTLYTINTTYTGSDADWIRSYLNNTSRSDIEQQYLNYYSALYPAISVDSSMEWKDDRKKNKITVTEHYSIKDFWRDNENVEGQIYGEVYALQLRDVTSVTNSAERDVDYYLSYPRNLYTMSRLHMPSSWPVENNIIEVKSDDYQYRSAVSYNSEDNIIVVSRMYKTLDDHVSAEDYPKFIEDHKKIRKDLSFFVMKTDDATTMSSVNYYFLIVIILALAIFVVAVYFARKLYREYDPEPVSWAGTGRRIGGWLWLIGIGLILGPLINIIELVVETTYLNPAVWRAYLSADTMLYNPGIALLLFFELSYKIIFVVYGILCAILFFSRRTSAPKLVIGLYALAVIFPAIDYLLAYLFFPEFQLTVKQQFQDLAFDIAKAAIWIPYLYISDIVKETFSRRRNSNEIYDENTKEENSLAPALSVGEEDSSSS